MSPARNPKPVSTSQQPRSGVKNIIIVQNKVDIVDQKRALESYKEIKAFVKGTVAENAPIIPISAQRMINIDVLLDAIQTFIPTPHRDPDLAPLMYIIRSFDFNKPGTTIDDLEGGIIGAPLFHGKIRPVGDENRDPPRHHGRTVKAKQSMTHSFCEIVKLTFWCPAS
jgi:translation initiation factor 2 gamma subunit (eIF-2gamma)